LHSDVDRYDPENKRGVALRAEQEQRPGDELQECADAVEAVYAYAGDVFPGDGGGQRPCDAA